METTETEKSRMCVSEAEIIVFDFRWAFIGDCPRTSVTRVWTWNGAELKSWLRDRNTRDSSVIRHTICLPNGLAIHHSIENTTLVSGTLTLTSTSPPISITLQYDKLKCFPENLFLYCWMQISKLSSAFPFITPTALPHGTRHSCLLWSETQRCPGVLCSLVYVA